MLQSMGSQRVGQDWVTELNWRAVNYTHVISLKAKIENHLLKQVYLFIYFWLHWVFAATHGLPLVAMRGLLSVVASRVAECELRELRLTGSRASAGSAVAVWGLICSLACGIFPDQGSNAGLLHCQVDFFFFFTTESPGKPEKSFLSQRVVALKAT